MSLSPKDFHVFDISSKSYYARRAIDYGFTLVTNDELANFLGIAEATYVFCPFHLRGEYKTSMLFIAAGPPNYQPPQEIQSEATEATIEGPEEIYPTSPGIWSGLAGYPV